MSWFNLEMLFVSRAFLHYLPTCSCSKAAIIGLAKSTGKEYAETGITVNSLAPALILTDMVLAAGSAALEKFHQ